VQLVTTIRARTKSRASPRLYREIGVSQCDISSGKVEQRETIVRHIRWNQADDTPPSELDAAKVAEAEVQPICPSLDFREDPCVMLRDPLWHWSLPFLRGWPTEEVCGGHTFEIRVLDGDIVSVQIYSAI
jgi:hypothetical protein